MATFTQYGIYRNIHRARRGDRFQWSVTIGATAGSPGRVIGYADSACLQNARIGRSDSKHKNAISKGRKQVYQWFYGDLCGDVWTTFSNPISTQYIVGKDTKKNGDDTGKLLFSFKNVIFQDGVKPYDEITCRHDRVNGDFYRVSPPNRCSGYGILNRATWRGEVTFDNRNCFILDRQL